MATPSRSTPSTAAPQAEMRLGWRMAGLSFTMASEVAAGALVGLLIDHFADTAPRWLLIGSIAGIAVGMLSFIRGAVAMNRLVSQQERDRAARGIPPPAPLPPDDDRSDQGDSWDAATDLHDDDDEFDRLEKKLKEERERQRRSDQ